MAAYMNLVGLHYSGRLVAIFGAIMCIKVVASDGRYDQCCPPISHEYKSSQKNTQYQLIRLPALASGVYRNRTTKTVMRCASACLKEDSCRSFNYCKDDELCQLNSAVKSENSTALQSSGRCVHFKDTAREAWKDAPSHVPGSLKHVSIGEAGVWGIHSQDRIYYRAWCGCSWTQISGGLKQLDVGRNVVWGVNAGDGIFYRKVSTSNPSLTSWISVSGALKHVSVSQKGHVWGVNRHNMVYHRRGVSVDQVAGSTWFNADGRLVQISIGSSGVWGISTSNTANYREGTYGDPDSDPNGSAWETVGSAEISLKYVSSGDVIYAVDSDDAIYCRVGTSAESPTGTVWKQIDGNLKQIESVSSTFWGVDGENNIYTNDTY